MLDFLSTLPNWLVGVALAVIASAFLYVLIFQPDRFDFAGLSFGRVPQADLSLRGAVIAFDRTTNNGEAACPEDWTLFEPAIGRMVLGAGSIVKDGPPSNSRMFQPSYSENQVLSVGGEVLHDLTIAEMPTHTHSIYLVGSFLKPDPNSKNPVAHEIAGPPRGQEFSGIETAGGGSPHNNMPPYIALYFCKKN